MSQEQEWNDTSRDELRETLRWFIRGKLRLMDDEFDGILNACRDIYMTDVCPEEELDTFVQFAADELKQAEARLASEMSDWPPETDCDRLDRAEAVLRDQGILFWQVSPCCDTCTLGELGGRIDAVDDRHPGFRDRIRGYAFFIDQSLPESLAEGTELSVYLGYGWLSPDGREVSSDVYETNALGIAREVSECLHREGIEVDWDGNLARKIHVSLNWQRRTLLE